MCSDSRVETSVGQMIQEHGKKKIRKLTTRMFGCETYILWAQNMITAMSPINVDEKDF